MRLLPICYFGFTDGSPPGVPGGGITGILSPDGGGVCFIWGSTFVGGLMTPPEWLSSELLLPLAGSAGALGCSMGLSAATAGAPKAANVAAMSHILRIVVPPCAASLIGKRRGTSNLRLIGG